MRGERPSENDGEDEETGKDPSSPSRERRWRVARASKTRGIGETPAQSSNIFPSVVSARGWLARGARMCNAARCDIRVAPFCCSSYGFPWDQTLFRAPGRVGARLARLYGSYFYVGLHALVTPRLGAAGGVDEETRLYGGALLPFLRVRERKG